MKIISYYTNRDYSWQYPRDKHATISVLTFTANRVSLQDEYLESVSQGFEIKWFKEKSGNFQTEIERIKNDLNARFNKRGKNVILECLQFGGNHEFWDDFPDEEEIQSYFSHCYSFAVKHIGYLGTDKNIVCALTVTEPNRRNLFVYYLPITDKWRVKCMSNDKSEAGNKLQQRDEFGAPIYFTYQSASEPLLCHSEFWKRRGEALSYSILQERFFTELSERYGAKRGESTSLLKYTAPEQAERFNRHKEDNYDIFKNPKGIWV